MSFEGRGKGPEEPAKPYELDDTLRTTATAKVLDLLGEGEWEGLADGPASIYFDDTPLAVRDASGPDGFRENFKGVRWTFRPGTADQSYIPGFAEACNEVGVGIEVKTETAVTRSIVDANVDAVSVRISLPALKSVDDAGNVSGSAVVLRILTKAEADADFKLRVTAKIEGKASTTVEKAYRVELEGIGPWQVRVERVTENATTKIANQTMWSGFTEIIYARMRYPHSVLTALEFDAAYFDSIPTRSYDVKMQKIKLPINRFYNSATDAVEYLGPWDGRFKASKEWSDNPAWCLYDVLTSNRYGLGKHLVDGNTTLVDKAALYQFGKYADEVVNGRRRFTCNAYFQTQLEAFDFVNQMASVFRGMAMWANGWVAFAQDAPSDPEHIFTNANVEEGAFTYQSNSRRDRVTAAYVYWNDPEQGYRRVVEFIEDRDAVLRYGFNPTNITAVGCTNRAQAIQTGKWMVYGSCYEPTTISFASGMVSSFVKPGSLILVQDKHKAGRRIAGRVVAVPSAYAVTLDQDVFIEAGIEYFIKLVYPTKADGSPRVYEAKVTNQAGSHRTILHVGGLPTLPEVGMVFIVSSSALQAQTFRVSSVTESDTGKYQFTAVEHNPGKFDFIEKAVPLPEYVVSAGARPSKPIGVVVSDELYLDATTVNVLLRVQFSPDTTANKHFVRYRRESSSWETFGPFETPYAEIPRVLEGNYVIEVWSKNMLGMESQHAEVVYTVQGKSRPPADTAILSAELQRAGILVTMAPIADLDFDVLELRWAVTDVGWASAELVDRVKGGSALLSTAFGKGTSFWFYAKAVDTSGNYSVNAAKHQFKARLPAPPRHLTAVANLGYVDMHWEAGERTDFYEVRAGNTWATAEYIGRTDDLAYTFEWARPGQAYFWAESYDALGNSSGTPSAVSKLIAKTSGRNVVYEVDYAALGWPGRLLNLTNSGISLDLAPGRFYGEYVSRFSIDHEHRVLVAMDGQVSAVYEDGATWADYTFAWNSPSADIPWWRPGDIAQVDVAHYIATNTDAVDPTLLEDFTFEDTLAGTVVTGAAANATYAPGVFDSNGLVVTPVAGMSAAVATPAVFSYHFWNVVEQLSQSKFLHLTDGSGSWLQLGYDAARQVVYVRRSEGDVVEVSLGIGDKDVVFIGVSQSATTLSLFAMKHGIPYRYAEAEVAFPHGYNSLKLN